MSSSQRITIALVGFSLLLFAAGCKKKVPVAPPPPPPQPAVKEVPPKPEPPKITLFSTEPSSIQRGESALLHWTVERASTVSIEPSVGTVPAEGTRRVSPSNSTTYRLHASGPGGVADAMATITVAAPPPPPPPPPPAPPKKTLVERITGEVSDAYFDYDKYNIRDDARTALTNDVDALKTILKDFPNAMIAVEGHCDERGSAEYNLGLGDRRATAARDYLVQLGVPADRLKTISYGKERPQCTESNETCWQKNRRAHFSAGSDTLSSSHTP